MMLCDHFVWLHIPRTGGTWLNRILRETVPTSWNAEVFADHWGEEDLRRWRPSYLTKPRFWFVRNPWDWWLSLWAFWHRSYWNQLHSFAPDRLWDHPTTVWAKLLEPFGSHQTQEGFEHAIRMRIAAGESESGFHQKAGAGSAGCFEYLRSDAQNLIEMYADPPASMLDLIRVAPPAHESGRPRREDFYSAELRVLVARHERPIIDLVGYEF